MAATKVAMDPALDDKVEAPTGIGVGAVSTDLLGTVMVDMEGVRILPSTSLLLRAVVTMHVTGIGYTLRGRVRIAPEDDLT